MKNISTFSTSISRDSEITVSVTYFPLSNTCSGQNYASNMYTTDSSNLHETFTLYNYFNEYLDETLPSITQDITVQIVGCGNEMQLQVCYQGTCEQAPVNECISMDPLMQSLTGNVENLGSVYIQISAPCSSGSDNSQVSSSSGGVSCLSGDSKVYLDTSQQVFLRSLEVGDSILTYDTERKMTRPTTIIGWLDKKVNTQVSFLRVIHQMGHLKISPYHLIIRLEPDNQISVVFAKEISVNDKVFFNNDSLTFPSQVMKIEQIHQTDAFAPLTTTGTFLADGVLVSCYAHFRSHPIAHLAFAPYRWYYALFGNLQPQPRLYIEFLKIISKYAIPNSLYGGMGFSK
ncbi:Desert hedgehog protein [Galdieria sulphuraria]|nr:Desert hedgehog protein [Galdieria sulphuraria]